MRIFRHLSLIILLFLCSNSAFAYQTAKITVKAVDERGEPVVGAAVSVSFLVAKTSEWGMSQRDKNGKTDKEGLFAAESESSSMLGLSVDKEGYYQSGRGYEFKEKVFPNRWTPWNPTIEVVLKKKRNPVPMYVKGTNWVKVPKLDTPVGYDLLKGDWVIPYGQGVVGDMLVNFNSDYKEYRDYESRMTITFPNEEDGIQEFFFNSTEQSYYKWPFEAPATGYLKKIEKFKSDRPVKGVRSNVKIETNYIFRVRTKTDKDGNIVEAKYGKIAGDLQVGREPELGMTYYLNPDGTRNLEEDPERNLFKNK